MRKLWTGLVLVPALLLGACGGGDDNPLTIPERIDAIEECLPDLYPKLDQLKKLAALWRSNQGTTPPNPPGLVSVVNGSVLNVSYIIGSCALDMEISFWSPTGQQETVDFSGTTSLSEQIQKAATDLAAKHASSGPNPFMLGRWTLTNGTTLSGSGNLLGSIGGVANQNELEYIRTTESIPNGGEPATADSVIEDTGTNCELVFRFSPLATDIRPNQDYAEGTINFSVSDGNATANGTITLDSTAIAVVEVNGVPGSFDFNLDTFAVTYNP